jgi:D-glycero-D-manno-heptose 1,7-bisphosphate phosphatase
MTGRAGVFLDRDGTVIEDTGFVRDPAMVRLVPGAAEAIRRLNQAGIPVTIVTNQSGIARGLLTEADYAAVAAHLETLLAAAGARIDATYFCPHYPAITGPCQCRKPGPLHYRAAAERFGLDLSQSVWIGDRLTDLLGAQPFGGRGILVETGEGAHSAHEAAAQGFAVAADLAATVDLILRAPAA